MRAFLSLLLVLCCTAVSVYAGPREDWRALYFPPDVVTNPALENSIWGDAADPDHDGHNNLFEYATGLNPTNFDASTGLAFARSNGTFSIGYNQRTNDNQLFFKLDFSTNLLTWSVPSNWTQTNLPAAPGFQSATVQGLAPSAPAYFRLRIAGSRPVAIATNITLFEDTPTVIQLPASDPNAGTNLLQFVITKLPQQGALYDGTNTGNPITFTNLPLADPQARVLYFPATNINGSDSLAFKVVRNWVESSEATVNLSITPVEDPPVAVGTNVLTLENVGIYITLGGTDPDGDSLTSTIRLLPTNGKLYQVLDDDVTLGAVITNTPTIVSNHHKLVYYLPNQYFFKVPVGDLIRYDLFDGLEFSNTVTVVIGVQFVNQLPVVTPGTNIVYIDQPVAGLILGIYDEDTPIDGYMTQFPAKGKLYRKTVAATNLMSSTNNHFSDVDFVYVNEEPITGPSATYKFSYYVQDVGGYVSPVYTNVLEVLLRELPPTLQGCQTNASTPHNTPVVITLNGMDPDGDSSALNWTIPAPPQNGTLAAQDIVGNFVTITTYPFSLPSSDPSFGWPVQYTPAPGFGLGSLKTNTFTFTVQDQTGLTNSGTVVITVGP